MKETHPLPGTITRNEIQYPVETRPKVNYISRDNTFVPQIPNNPENSMSDEHQTTYASRWTTHVNELEEQR